jgi:hypothetical protein
MTVTNIPGRVSIAQKQLLFKAMLPPLGFNTYYFQIKSKRIVWFSITYLFIYIDLLTAEERVKSSVKVTYNEECILKNQVRCLIDPHRNKYDRLFI